MTITVKFKLEKTTKGAVRYQEIDDNGAPAEAWAKIGTLYVRKTAFERDSIPQTLTVSVTTN
jgi:hypothetical protein